MMVALCLATMGLPHVLVRYYTNPDGTAFDGVVRFNPVNGAMTAPAVAQLAMRYDGDEGLFRAYESVEFLAPLYAGVPSDERARRMIGRNIGNVRGRLLRELHVGRSALARLVGGCRCVFIGCAHGCLAWIEMG